MLYFVIFAAILLLDVATKLWAVSALQPVSGIPILEGVFHLTYVENRGAAFGLFQDGRMFFIVITIVLLSLIIFGLKKFEVRSKTLSTGLVFVSAGAVGNLIDRIFRGFVVDFFDFCLIDFPVFNVADVFVCVGAGLVIMFIIFFEGDAKGKKDLKDV